MTNRAPVSPGKLKRILRPVSRSFFASIRLLPGRLRDPVALGYLLARATDTVADTVEVPVELRKETLAMLSAIIQGNRSPDDVRELQKTFMPFQKNEAERALIQFLPECLAARETLTYADREDVRVVLEKITSAQNMDLDSFGEPGQPRALLTAADLNEYTYLIAGSVGEFWTRICSRHLKNFADVLQNRMLDLGRRYGIGLQLINILRDAPADLRAGRCYFPADELQAIGLEPAQILERRVEFQPVAQKWLNEAKRGLDAGMEYSYAIGNWRVRAATALPALIGARTIALLRAAGPDSLDQKVKVPRPEVRKMMTSILLKLASPKALDRIYRQNQTL